MKIRRGYVDGRHGQVHYYETTTAPAQAGARPLYCLHATAYSGRTFEPLMQILGDQRRVVALDTPGYGGSDAPASRIDLPAYADAIADAIKAIEGTNGPVDIFGYHTGAMIAVDLAARRPELVRRMCLLGIPYFTGDDAITWEHKLVHETALSESFDQFRSRWEYLITHRPVGMPLVRAFDNFVDELRSYPREWWAHRSLFEYDATASLRSIEAREQVINIEGPLTPFSSNAAALIPDSVVHAVPQITSGALDFGAGLIAQVIGAFLGQPSSEIAGRPSGVALAANGQ